jgi:beta-glucosidase
MRVSVQIARMFVVAGLVAACVGQAAAPATNSGAAATTAAAKVRADVGRPKANDAKFEKMHASFIERAKAGDVDLLFLGDSITAGWAGKGKAVWEKYYASKYKPANFGIGGDTTQNVIWRIENGELEGIRPKVVVLMIGTNNTGANSADEIVAGNAKILKIIREKLPESKVLLLAVFPRGPRTDKNGKTNDGAQRNEVIREVNKKLAKMADGEKVRYLDLGEKFLVDGKIPDEIMPDQLHPNEKGYEIWAEGMEGVLGEMMK